MIDIKDKLSIIWNKDYIKSLPGFIKERGFNFSENNLAKDILITGINPSFRSTESLGNAFFDFQVLLKNSKWDNYWGPLKKLIIDKEDNIDLGAHTVYLDIFYFREQSQNQLKKRYFIKSVGH